MSRFVLLTALCGLLIGCETSPATSVEAASSSTDSTATKPTADAAPFGPMRTQGGFDYVFYEDEPMKPAYMRRDVLGVGKADASDIRAAAPERYAITAPPEGKFRAMVEWEPMRAIVMSYTGSTSAYEGATNTAVQIGKHAASVAEVWYLVDSQSAANLLTQELQQAGLSASAIQQKVRFIVEPLDSIWFIDSGPLPLVNTTNNTMAFADFRYYWNRPYDDGIPTWLGRILPQLDYNAPADTYRMPLSTEGGTFMTTSDGICFTGTRQLYNQSCEAGNQFCDTSLDDWPFTTNGKKTKQDYLEALEDLQNTPEAQELKAVWAEYAGCKDTIVTYSITDDGTGHIDMYLKVVDDNTVLLGEYEAPFDAPGTPTANTVLSCWTNKPCPSGYLCQSGKCVGSGVQATNALRLDATAEFIENYTKPNGQSFTVPRLVMPGHRSTNSGSIPFTYINSTFINGLNLWPATTYTDWVGSRNQAENKWEQVMPDHEHIWIDSTELSFWSGAIHCITRTIPDLPTGPWIADGVCSGGTCQAPDGGYDSVCTPGQSSEPVCYGPEWLCGCNDCTQSCPLPGEDPCNGITYTGCCDGKILTYCDQGELVTQSCQSCGWDNGSNWYDCGQSGADPSGEAPYSCDEITNPCSPSCGGKDCGPDGCGGSCGSCIGDETCDPEGQCVAPVCVPNCQGKQCGGDGCGDTCGSCNEGQSCTGGVCVDLPEEGCGDVSWEGVCDDGYMAYCNDGELVEQNCPSGCCGWFPSEDYYWCYQAEYCGDFCVDECDTGDYGCSEEGTHAWTCSEPAGAGCRVRDWSTCADGCDQASGICAGVVCEPACSGKTCGDDGCGGDCGLCDAGDTCVAGQCTPPLCVPECENKACGDDGCGGECGTCDPGYSCNTKGVCIDDSPVCEPSCEGKDCGDDGCGGVCGACSEGESCNDKGQCIETGCQADCEGKVCGDNGCGGLCGTCDEGDVCDAEGLCVPQACAPQCDGKVCGDDGCGGSCGTCSEGQLCSATGECEKVDGCGGLTYFGACEGSVVVWCEDNQVQSFDCATQGKECGDQPGVGFTCVDPPACVPACDGRVCGDDGCGGLCGTCETGSACEAGQCVAVDPGDPRDRGADDPEVTNLGGSGDDPLGTGEPAVEDSSNGSASTGCQGAGGGAAWPLLWLLALAWPLRRRR